MARPKRTNDFPATAGVALIFSQSTFPYNLRFSTFYLIRMLSHLTVFVLLLHFILHIPLSLFASLLFLVFIYSILRMTMSCPPIYRSTRGYFPRSARCKQLSTFHVLPHFSPFDGESSCVYLLASLDYVYHRFRGSAIISIYLFSEATRMKNISRVPGPNCITWFWSKIALLDTACTDQPCSCDAYSTKPFEPAV